MYYQYLDGVISSSASLPGDGQHGALGNSGTDLYVGGRVWVESLQSFGGKLDNVEIYMTDLPSNEVFEAYNSTTNATHH